MALIRCTCIYRPTEPDDVVGNRSPIAVAVRDPHCPAHTVHERADRARAAVPQVDRFRNA